MRLVIQRVKRASVTVEGKAVAAIGNGLLVFVGLGRNDADPAARPKIRAALAKLPVLRIFPDKGGHMNASLADFGGEVLLVSQFTLFADCRKGRRPSFSAACPPGEAAPLYADVVETMKELLPGKVQSGIFAADMDVALVNWGPVTISLDSDEM